MEVECIDMTEGASNRLIEAYEALMSRAPGAAFHRARELYFNKYPLPQEESEQDLRLYIVDEQLKETIEPAGCLLYTSPSPRDGLLSRMPSSA